METPGRGMMLRKRTATSTSAFSRLTYFDCRHLQTTHFEVIENPSCSCAGACCGRPHWATVAAHPREAAEEGEGCQEGEVSMEAAGREQPSHVACRACFGFCCPTLAFAGHRSTWQQVEARYAQANNAISPGYAGRGTQQCALRMLHGRLQLSERCKATGTY
jgi:hypothetical protein